MVAIGIIIGFKMNDNNDLPFISEMDPEITKPIGEIEEVLRFIENKYVDSVNRDEIYETAFNAIFQKLDPHSLYIPPDDLVRVNDEMNGNYVGLGVEVFQMEDTLYFTKVTKDSPAEKAGLKVFDKLLSIDGEMVAGVEMQFDTIRKKLKKELGSKVSLDLKRQNENVNVTIDVDNIPINSVHPAILITDSISLIKIDRFSNKTYKEFMDQLEFLVNEKKLRHLIIDLRGNPGGYLPEAVNMLSQLFSEKELLLVYTDGSRKKKSEYKTTGKPFFDVDKIAVLVDENSASASEIVAAALKEWDRGVIIGRRTFGKGLVQEQYPLANGGALRITVSRYYTPSGRSIQKSYENIESYNYEIDERQRNGELYHTSDTILNSSFRSLKLGRMLIEGGGVSPDIFIPLDTLSHTASFIKMDNLTYIQLLKEIAQNGYANSNKPIYIQKIEQIIAENAKSNNNRELAEQLLNSNLELLLDSENTEIEEKDSFVKEAVDFIISGKSLLDLQLK
jgi:carboxyl-terminal processing protease